LRNAFWIVDYGLSKRLLERKVVGLFAEVLKDRRKENEKGNKVKEMEK
jgi:hypothetical protein